MIINSCRFCKNNIQEDLIVKKRGKMNAVWCAYCGATGPEAETDEKAVRRWNNGLKTKVFNLAGTGRK